MRKKARGSIENRPTGWYLRLRGQRVPLGDHTEIRSEVSARREADAWIGRHYPEQLTTGQQVRAAKYFEIFLRDRGPTFRPTTRRNYRTVISGHLKPRLGHLALHQIGPREIEQFMADCLRRGKKPATVRNYRAVLLQLLASARKAGYDAQDINARRVPAPRDTAVEREQRSITPEEMDRILATARDPYRVLYAVMGFMGLRIGEALGLAWRHLDIDSVEPLASIRQTAQFGALAPLKTKTSRAELPIPSNLVAILRAYRAVWQPNEAGLLFTTRTGRPMSAENVRARHWVPMLKAAGVPHAGFHALRHGITRQLFAVGVGADVVMRLMRHANLVMTQRYTHTNSVDLRRAADAAAARNIERTATPRDTASDSAGEKQGSAQ